MHQITISVTESVYHDVRAQALYNGIAINRQAARLVVHGLLAQVRANQPAAVGRLRARVCRLIEREEHRGITERKIVAGISGATYLDIAPIIAALVASGEVAAVNTGRTTLYYPGDGAYVPMDDMP